MTSLLNPTFDEARERSEQRGDEWKFGAAQVSLFAVPLEVRKNYQPIGEVQRGIEDTMDCASRDKVNDCETQLNYAYRNNLLIPEIKNFLEGNGYVVWRDGKAYIECSDAYIAIKSKTTKQGNSLKAPAHAVSEWGLVPKSRLPLEPGMSWDQYHSPLRITKVIENLGTEFKARLPINYEQVLLSQFKEAIKKSEICCALYAWPFPDGNGVYQRVEHNFNHAVKLMEPLWVIQDNYLDSFDSDYIKQLAPNYRLFDWGYQMCFTAQVREADILRKSGILEQLMGILIDLQKYLNSLGNKVLSGLGL